MFNHPDKQHLKKPMLVMLISIGILFGGIFIYKMIGRLFMEHYFATHSNPPVTVSTTTVQYSPWQPQLTAVGSLRATLGVNVTAQLAGMVQKIYFKPGTMVKGGTVLVQQNADTEIGQLQALQATAALDKITYERDKKQYKIQAISKEQLDTDEQNLKNANAQVVAQTATVTKLTISAPFSGRLGICNVYPGQYLNPGDNVVSLQSLDPIFVDFYLPQQAVSQLHLGQTAKFTTDSFAGKTFTGTITTVEPNIDVNNRNVEVEATIANPQYTLLPGMFGNATVDTDKPVSYLTVPQSAITFNPYGDIAYLVKQQTGKDDKGKPILSVEQVFVTTGETRGDQVAILSGLKAGDVIVSSGQLKLKNGSLIIVNNTVQPPDSPSPDLSNDHTG
jgi:membrane fusion protein (multidrug efflux system)